MRERAPARAASSATTTALTGFAADLNGPQLERRARRPRASRAVEPDAEISAHGHAGAGGGGDRAARRSAAAGGATPALAHAPATTRRRGARHRASTSPTRTSTRVTGVNCVKPGTPAQDDNGHGTNVAGIVAARNTGKGVVGVAPGTRVYAVKVLNNRAVGTLSQFLCGINWVAANAAALEHPRREHEHRRRRR